MTSLMSFGNSNVTSTTFTAVSTFPLLVQQLKPCHALAELLVDRLSIGTPQLLSVGNCQSCTVPARIPRCLRITLLNIRHLHAVLTCFNSPVGKYSGKKYTANSKINVTNQWRRFSGACATEVTQAPITMSACATKNAKWIKRIVTKEERQKHTVWYSWLRFSPSRWPPQSSSPGHLWQETFQYFLSWRRFCMHSAVLSLRRESQYILQLTDHLFPEKSKFGIGKVGNKMVCLTALIQELHWHGITQYGHTKTHQLPRYLTSHGILSPPQTAFALEGDQTTGTQYWSKTRCQQDVASCKTVVFLWFFVFIIY
jgi:hypothetical protein